MGGVYGSSNVKQFLSTLLYFLFDPVGSAVLIFLLCRQRRDEKKRRQEYRRLHSSYRRCAVREHVFR